MHLAQPGLLGSKKAFAETYGTPMESGDAEAGARLRRRIRPFLLRRKKEEVATELLHGHRDLARGADEGERDIHDAILLATRKDIVSQLQAGGSVLEALEALLRLRQACCHTGLLPGREAQDSSKIQVLMDNLSTCISGGHKALVFSQWTGFLDKIEPHLKKKKFDFLRLDGSTRNRGDIIDQFQSPDGPPVLLLS